MSVGEMLTREQIEAIRDYLLDLECPFTESSVNALCDAAIETFVPSAALCSTAEEVVRKAVNDYTYVTPPHLRDSDVLADRIIAAIKNAAPQVEQASGPAGRDTARPAGAAPVVASTVAATDEKPRRWRVKQHGDDLITYWKSKPRHTDQYAAAEIIEELEQDLADAQQRIREWRDLCEKNDKTPPSSIRAPEGWKLVPTEPTAENAGGAVREARPARVLSSDGRCSTVCAFFRNTTNLRGETVKKKPLTAEQIRAKTPATEKWVQDALKYIGEPGLDDNNNRTAYGLRSFELSYPRLARLVIPLFAPKPQWPWWKARQIVITSTRVGP